MIRAVTGRPGEGKTCFVVSQIIMPVLLYSRRVVATNISFKFDGIRAEFERVGLEFDPAQLVELKPGAIGGSHGLGASNSSARFWEQAPKGALVVLDEAGEFLNSYDYVGKGQGAARILGEYARIHRHVGHDTYLIVQSLSHIAKQPRDLVSEHISCYNFCQHPVLGIIKLPLFLVRHWDIGGAANATASRVRLHRHRARDFALYYTDACASMLTVAEGEGELKKEVARKGIVRRVLGVFAEKPIMLVLFLVAVALWLFMDYMFSMTKSVKSGSHENENEIETKVLGGAGDGVANSLLDGRTGVASEGIRRPAFNGFAGKGSARGYELRSSHPGASGK